jgi:hypothetical protein
MEGRGMSIDSKRRKDYKLIQIAKKKPTGEARSMEAM